MVQSTPMKFVRDGFQTRCAAFAIALTAGSLGFGQGTTLTTGTIVTGQCQGHEKDPGCVLPNLFGPQGLSLFSNPGFPHYAHFIGSAQTTINQTLSSSIATQLAILPIISPSSGFTYKYDSASGAFVRTTTSFGPIYSERAETIGRGKFTFGVSYQRFRFSSLDGVDLHKVPAVFGHVPNTGPGAIPEPYEADVIKTSNSVNLNMDQTVLYGSVGVTDRLDLSVAIPLVSVRMGASSDASIVQVSGLSNLVPGLAPFNPHEFDGTGRQTNTYSSNGSASGIGDVTFRLKGAVLQKDSFRVAAALDVRAPSGDPQKFLGSGAIGVKPFIAVSAGKRYSPHVNLGYQWNGSSVLAGNITGTTISEDSTGAVVIKNGPATKERLPSQFFYSLGADLGVTNRLTLAFDYLGQTLRDAPRVADSTFTTQAISQPQATGAIPLPTITGQKSTFTMNSGAAGLKYNLFNRLLLTADILFRLDNNGLRQNITPLVALSYAFGR